MTFECTVKQCAERLGITEQRVYQLIKEGLLPAEKVAGRFFVEEEAVEARRESNPTAGRPAKRAHAHISSYTLMNRQYEVFDLVYDEDASEFSSVGTIYDLARAPFGLTSPRGSRVSLRELTSWWAHRSIPLSRQGMEEKLASLGVVDPSRIPFKSLGLSLSDQYWLRPEGESIAWDSVNFFTNHFGELETGDWLSQVGLRSPDNTSEGQLPKRWTKENDAPMLLKGGGSLNQEPYNEVVATELFSRVLREDEYVPYEIGELSSGEKISRCANFLTDEEEYIPAMQVLKAKARDNSRDDFRHFLECCQRLGVHDAELSLAKMIVCDDILGNTDRHWRNFGLIRNVNTLEYRMAPLFDTGNSMWIHLSEEALQAGDFEFSTKPFYADPNRQLRLVEDYSWLQVERLDGFSEKAGEILSENPYLQKRIPFIRQAIDWRIGRIKVIGT